MRKKVLLLLLLLFLAGCNNASKYDNPNKDDIMNKIYITEIQSYDINWEQIQFSVDLNEGVLSHIKPIDRNQDAVEIANNIIDEFHRQEHMSAYTLTSITHSMEDNVWCFEYSINQSNVDVDDLIDCGCLYVAIDGEKGVLIKAWLEE